MTDPTAQRRDVRKGSPRDGDALSKSTRRAILGIACVGTGLAMAGFDAVVRTFQQQGRRERDTVPESQPPEDEQLRKTLALLDLPDHEFVRRAMTFVRQASLFPGEERLIGGCARLARLALRAESSEEADRVMKLALRGFRLLGAAERMEEFRKPIETDDRFVQARPLLPIRRETSRTR